MTIRALILSGGGGRGAFHAGVYDYLDNPEKPGVDADHQGMWEPDIIVGTSIGAVNGAAIAQGFSAERLKALWMELDEHEVEGLPPGIRQPTRAFMNIAMKGLLGRRLPKEKRPLPAKESWVSLNVLPRWMPKWIGKTLIGRWDHLLDTAPLYRTLKDVWRIDPDKINRSEKALLITATNIRTGELTIFSNRALTKSRRNVKEGISLERILASCSIPMVYPVTEVDGDLYWDGALIANTPLGAALDAIPKDRDPAEAVEIVVVMMTPWKEDDKPAAQRDKAAPENIAEAITWALDWMLLASFRTQLRITRRLNRLAAIQREDGQPAYRHVEVVIVAPEKFLSTQRIIDYDKEATQDLINQGFAAAQGAFQGNFRIGS